jgi:transposase-like protein
MTKRRRNHPPEFKAQAVDLVAQGHQTVSAIARDLSISESLLRNWMKLAGVDNALKGRGGRPPNAVQTQMAIAPAVIEALSPASLARFHAGKPKAVVKAQMSRDPAELMVLLDLKPADLEPLQRIKMLANRTGMSTRDLVNALLDLAVVEGIKHKGDRE